MAGRYMHMWDPKMNSDLCLWTVSLIAFRHWGFPRAIYSFPSLPSLIGRVFVHGARSLVAMRETATLTRPGIFCGGWDLRPIAKVWNSTHVFFFRFFGDQKWIQGIETIIQCCGRVQNGSDTDPLLLDVEVAKMVRIRRSLTHLVTAGIDFNHRRPELFRMIWGWNPVRHELWLLNMTSKKFKIATLTLGFISVVLWLSHVGFHSNYSTLFIDYCKHLKSSIQYTHWHPPDIP